MRRRSWIVDGEDDEEESQKREKKREDIMAEGLKRTSQRLDEQ